MSEVVVDSNVAIAANGRDTHASLECQLACVQRLRAIIARSRVVIDDAGRIFEEYKRHMRFSGQPGVGDAFFLHLHNHQHNQARVRLVGIAENGEERGFAELPPNALDPSDRKFLAVSVVAKAPILNATDSDWREHQALVDGLGVVVEQLCPEHAQKPA